MTDTIAAPTDPAAAPDGRGRRRARSTVIVMLVFVVALAVAAGFPIWHAMASSASAQVRVMPGTDAMVCNGKTVPYRISGEDGGEPRAAFVIPIEKGMTCQFTVTVINHSGHGITVRDLKFPAVRDRDNSGPMIIAGNDSSQKFHGSSNDNDATYDVGESIAAGESADYQFRLDANPRACSSKGTATLTNFPATHISVLHQHRTVEGQISIDVRIKNNLAWSGCAS